MCQEPGAICRPPSSSTALSPRSSPKQPSGNSLLATRQIITDPRAVAAPTASFVSTALHSGGRPLLVAAALATIACSDWRPREPSLDGWPLGSESPCAIDGALADPAFDMVLVATSHLGTTPDDVVEVRCFGEGAYLDGGQPYLRTSTVGVSVVVVTFRDGTRRAVGVSCGIGGCRVRRPPTARPG